MSSKSSRRSYRFMDTTKMRVDGCLSLSARYSLIGHEHAHTRAPLLFGFHLSTSWRHMWEHAHRDGSVSGWRDPNRDARSGIDLLKTYFTGFRTPFLKSSCEIRSYTTRVRTVLYACETFQLLWSQRISLVINHSIDLDSYQKEAWFLW